MGKNKYGKDFHKKRKDVKTQSGVGDPIRGSKIKASHILVEKYSRAQEIYDDLKSGSNFESLARNYSICSSKKKGGSLGEFAKGDMVPEFWNACIQLKVGQISTPIKTKFGYHIIKRTG